MDRYCCKMENTFRKATQINIHMQIRKMGSPYIFCFEPSVRSVCWIEPEVLIYCRLHHGIEGNFADALLDFFRSAFVFVQCGNFDLLFLEPNACCCARRLRSKRVAFEILICLRRADNIGSSSCWRESSIIGLLNLRDFAGGGDSNESAARAVFSLAISCCFLCISIISANWRLISVIFENIAADNSDLDSKEVPD
jgi:hypothetical protein